MATPSTFKNRGAGSTLLKVTTFTPNKSLGEGADIVCQQEGLGGDRTVIVRFDNVPITLTAGTTGDYGNVKLGSFTRNNNAAVLEYMFFTGGTLRATITPGTGSGTITTSKAFEVGLGTEAGDDDATSLTATEENIIIGVAGTSTANSIAAYSYGLTSNAPVVYNGTGGPGDVYLNVTGANDLLGATAVFYVSGYAQFSYRCCGNYLVD